jgi:uncharacterized repeat protein (TIGR02543 family)
MATVSKWTPFGVALNITATSGTVTRTSATQYKVAINVSWETYWDGAQTNYGMSASSGGITKTISTFGTKRSSGSGSFTGTYSISGNGSATKTISVIFKNYEEDWQGNVTESATKTVSFSVTVPAWTSYTVKYNANGGSGAPSSQTKWKDQTLKLSTTKPTRTGYTFQGWATSASGSVAYAAGANYTANASVTLYAVWKVITYTVKYNANGGSGAPSSQTKTYGKTLTLSSVLPTRTSIDDNGTLTEYVFKGWATASTSTSVAYKAGASYTANASVTLYAVWSKVVSVSLYDVSYNTNGGSEVIPQIKIKGETLKLRSTVPVRNGYTFSGWGLSADSTTVSYVSGANYTLDEDIVLYAIWEPWVHTVNFDANGGNGNIPENFISTMGADPIIISDVSPTKKGHVFKYWSTQPSGSGGMNYYAGDGYIGVRNGGIVTLYAIWDTKNISLYANGDCKAGEFIEDDSYSFNSDGTVHYVQFIEGSKFIKFDKTAFYASELLERVVAYLTDESDTYLTDESGNRLTTII